jgi:hypothetical protein
LPATLLSKPPTPESKLSRTLLSVDHLLNLFRGSASSSAATPDRARLVGLRLRCRDRRRALHSLPVNHRTSIVPLLPSQTLRSRLSPEERKFCVAEKMAQAKRAKRYSGRTLSACDSTLWRSAIISSSWCMTCATNGQSRGGAPSSSLGCSEDVGFCLGTKTKFRSS